MMIRIDVYKRQAEYEAWLLQQPASVILDNAFQYTTKQDILMHAESACLLYTSRCV